MKGRREAYRVIGVSTDPKNCQEEDHLSCSITTLRVDGDNASAADLDPMPSPPRWRNGQEESWITKLFTKEDPFHLHKTLGMLCLISFLFRMVNMGVKSDMAFASYPALTIPTLILHLLLNVSSFVFTNIPAKRIDSGYRIWPEYRAHSLIFACRSISNIALTHYEQHMHNPPLQPNYYINLLIVLATMAAADAASLYYTRLGRTKNGPSSVGPGTAYSSTFARDLQVPNNVKFIFSSAQIVATAGCLVGNFRRSSDQWIMIMIIQGNAFLMTLRRKNIASHYGLISIYWFMLWAGLVVGMATSQAALGWDRILLCFGVGNIVILFRLGGPHGPSTFPVWFREGIISNKYVLWTIAGLFLYQVGIPMVEGRLSPLFKNPMQGYILFTMTQMFVALLGRYKAKYGYPSQEKQNKNYDKPANNGSLKVKES